MTTRLAVDTARALAADAVQKVGNGHPGEPRTSGVYVVPARHAPRSQRCALVGSDRFVLSVRGRFVIRAKRSPAVPGGVQPDLATLPARRRRLTADDYRTDMTRRLATCNVTRSPD